MANGAMAYKSRKEETLERILKLFQCASCTAPFREPVSVPCGHIFCNPCFKILARRKTPFCPSCETPISASDGKRRADCSSLIESFRKVSASYSSGTPVKKPQDRKKSCRSPFTVTENRKSVNVGEYSGSPTRNDHAAPSPTQRRESPRRKSNLLGKRLQNALENSENSVPSIKDAKLAPMSSSKTSSSKVLAETAEVGKNSGAEPLDLTLNLSSSQKSRNLLKKRQFGFECVEQSLALDLSVSTSKSLETGMTSDVRKNPLIFRKRDSTMPSSKRNLYEIAIPGFTSTNRGTDRVQIVPTQRRSPRSSPWRNMFTTSSEASENSDNLLNKAMDILLEDSECKSSMPPASAAQYNNDESMPSDDDEYLTNVDINDAEKSLVVANKRSPPERDNCSSAGSKKIKMNPGTEVELLSSSPGKEFGPGVVMENGNDAGADSDSGSSDVLFQTPKSEVRTPERRRTKGRPEGSGTNFNPSTSKASPFSKISTLNMSTTRTPDGLQLLCTSPPSGTVVARALNHASVVNFHPFGNGFDEPLPDNNVASNNGEEENQVPVAQLDENDDMEVNEYPETPDKRGVFNSRPSAQKSQNNSGFETPKSRISGRHAASTFTARSPQSQTKIFGASSPRMSPSKATKKFVFCPTRLSSIQLTKLRQLCGMCGGKISREYTEDVTHLILTLENGRVPQTMKYLFAIAGKKWVIVFDWVEECLRQKKIVKEETFETSNFPGCDVGVKKSRLATVPLFSGYQFYVLGNLESSGASLGDWRNLLSKLGARVMVNEHEVNRNVWIVGDSLDRTEDYQGWFRSRGTITVAWEWILDCVLVYSKIQLAKTHYLITKLTPQELNEVGLPKELLP